MSKPDSLIQAMEYAELQETLLGGAAKGKSTTKQLHITLSKVLA